MIVEVVRVVYRQDGTLGVLLIDDFPVCCTLELPWWENKPMESCIPNGGYVSKRVQSPNHGNTFEVQNVKGRSHILFHGANTMSDLLGCIGLAEFFHRFEGKAGIANPSKGAAMIEFLALTKNVNEFQLLVTDRFGGK